MSSVSVTARGKEEGGKRPGCKRAEEGKARERRLGAGWGGGQWRNILVTSKKTTLPSITLLGTSTAHSLIY